MATIKPSMAKKNFAATPRRISSQITSLCRELNSTAIPVEVPVIPEQAAIVSECFPNVVAKVEKDGGSVSYGWAIWEWPRVFIEAEHHAVWEKDGNFIDITPKHNGERRILFLPDPNRVYDFSTERRIINVKRSLGRFESAGDWIRATNDWHLAIENNSVGREASFTELEMLMHQQRIAKTFFQVVVDLAAETKPRDRCICASGMEFRKCCGKLIKFD